MSVARPTRHDVAFALLITLLWLVAPSAPRAHAGNTPTMGTSAPRGAEKVGKAEAQVTASNRLYFAEGYTGQNAQVRFGETLSILNTNPITATGQIEYFLTSGITSTVHIAIAPHAQLTEDVARDVGANQQVSALIATDQTVSATRTISRTTALGGALSESVSGGETALSQYWYFAEGYTGATFQEYLTLFNPGDMQTSVSIQPYETSGSLPAAPLTRMVAAHSRLTVNLRAALPNQSLGLLVQADHPIAAERTLYWGAGSGSAKYGAAVNAGMTGPAAQWLFPYASIAGGNQSFLALVNPNSVEAHVRLTYYSDGGASAAVLNTTVDPGTRATLTLRPAIATDGAGFAVVAGSDVPIVCEEAQYFGGSPNIGTHAGSVLSGSAQPSTAWTFAGFDTTPYTSEHWFVLNTNAAEASLTATFFATLARAHFHALPGRLTSISLANIRDMQGEGSSVWSSDTPVVVVQVVRGAPQSSGMIVSGVPQQS